MSSAWSICLKTRMSERVRAKIASFLKIPPDHVQESAVLTDLVSESFVLVEMVMELQEEFGVRIMQEDLQHVKTVGDLERLIEKNPNF